MEIILGEKSIAWIWRCASKNGRVLQDLAEVSNGIGGNPIHERDFRWFLKDALLPRQRTAAYSRPGARQAMLASYLDMLVLEARARQEGLDLSPEFVRGRELRERGLLSEFMQGRDKAGPFCDCQQTDAERDATHRSYIARVRAEVGLRVVPRGG